ncbi:hypothetical protein [Streptomyces sp. NPDC002758]
MATHGWAAGQGHHITGLARSQRATDTLTEQDSTLSPGNLDGRRPEAVAAAARADVVIYAAQASPEQETARSRN